MRVNIVEKIGLSATLGQLAEECSEFAKAAQKLERILDGRNPTPVTREEAEANLLEEGSDVMNCMRVLAESEIKTWDEGIIESKLRRWEERVSAVRPADEVPVVRCKNCMYRKQVPGRGYENEHYCELWDVDDYHESFVEDDDFCSYGEQNEED